MTPHAIKREEQLYHLWEQCATSGAVFECASGERVLVISRGHRNDGPGPDYLGAVLSIDGVLAVGAVEMHISEREWFAHGHHRDQAYANVVLHVVCQRAEASRLTLPTLLCEVLERRDIIVAASTEQSVFAEDRLLVELSWARLLGRADEVLHSVRDGEVGASIRAAFVRRLYDCLGYSVNREPMRELAERVVSHDAEMPTASLEQIVSLLVSGSNVSPMKFAMLGRSFFSAELLTDIAGRIVESESALNWRYDTRPGNSPERRIWAAAKLTFDIYRGNLLRRLIVALESGARIERLIPLLTVRLGRETFLGPERASQIIINALLPVALAAGIALDRPALIAAACRCYRSAPSISSNHVVRLVERRYHSGRPLRGVFLQQGAIEFYQRYLCAGR